jgi:hypothetical protein
MEENADHALIGCLTAMIWKNCGAEEKAEEEIEQLE